MKLRMSKDWFEKTVVLEGGDEISAGTNDLVSLEPTNQGVLLNNPAAKGTTAVNELSLAFGALLRLMRRKKGYSIETLAEKIRVDSSEILKIEHDNGYIAKPRTVHQIAGYFNLPEKALLRLAGTVEVNDHNFETEALRFAARSEPITNLTREEQSALNEFVDYLSKTN